MTTAQGVSDPTPQPALQQGHEQTAAGALQLPDKCGFAKPPEMFNPINATRHRLNEYPRPAISANG
jgi:hypothetical protein